MTNKEWAILAVIFLAVVVFNLWWAGASFAGERGRLDLPVHISPTLGVISNVCENLEILT